MEGSNKKGTFGKVSLGASVSSLIDLKAELLRKREALKVQKLKQFHPEEGYVKQKLILGSDSGAATKKEPPKKTPDAPDISEEDADLKRSRAALQRKAKLYEKLSSGKVIPGDEEASLVCCELPEESNGRSGRRKGEARDAHCAHQGRGWGV
ncbi:hypothetical protein MTO96_010734 [Rhipicephalus appendiculatus]